MAEWIWNQFKEERLSGASDISSDTFQAVLVLRGGASNTNLPPVDDSTPEISDIADANSGGNGTVKTTVTLAGADFTAGRFDTSDLATTFPSIAAGGSTAATADGIVIFNSTDNRLMAVIEISTITFTGSDVVVTWDNTTDMNGETGGIFAL